jgi:hypothetical protein
MATRKPKTIRIRCGHCEKKSNQEILASYIHHVEHKAEDYHYEQAYPLRLLLCSLCNTVNYTVEFDEDDDEGDNDAAIKVLYPVPPKDIYGLPTEIVKAYKAARAVRMVDPNAFAVLLGRVLDLVCLDRCAEGNTLNEQLRDLATRGEIPGSLAEMAHQLRTLRNIGAHASLGELTDAETPILDDLCVAILDYVYASPYRVAQVENRIQRLKHHQR